MLPIYCAAIVFFTICISPITLRKLFVFAIPATIAIILIFASTELVAQGNLLLTPRRLVFDGKKRTQEINLANTGKDTARYLVSMVEIRMSKNGTFETITAPDSGQNFASTYIKFFPHSIVLAPNAAQTIKVQMANPASMSPGEYRSHIYVRAVPNEHALSSAKVGQDSSDIAVHLVPQFGLGLPIIIRIGESNTQVSISDISTEAVNDTTSALNMIFNRTGNMSVYGDLRVDYVGSNGDTKQVVSVDGIAVYTPTPKRFLHLELKNYPNVDYHKGKFYITYTTPPEQKSLKLAEAEFEVN